VAQNRTNGVSDGDYAGRDVAGDVLGVADIHRVLLGQWRATTVDRGGDILSDWRRAWDWGLVRWLVSVLGCRR
jgi:hypothetical protein